MSSRRRGGGTRRQLVSSASDMEARAPPPRRTSGRGRTARPRAAAPPRTARVASPPWRAGTAARGTVVRRGGGGRGARAAARGAGARRGGNVGTVTTSARAPLSGVEQRVVTRALRAIEDEQRAHEARTGGWYGGYAYVADDARDAAPTSERQSSSSSSSSSAAAVTASSYDWARHDARIDERWFLPRSTDDLVGNRSAVSAVDAWLRAWARYADGSAPAPPERRAMLVRGPAGVGKTSSVRLLLQAHGFARVVEINASDQRTSRTIDNELCGVVQRSTVRRKARGERAAIVLEEVDGMYTGATGVSTSGAHALVRFITQHARARPAPTSAAAAAATAAAAAEAQINDVRAPLVLLANDQQLPYMRKLAQLCECVTFGSVPLRDVTARIAALSARFHCQWSSAALMDKVALAAGKDMRKAMLLMATAMRAALAHRRETAQRRFERALHEYCVTLVSAMAAGDATSIVAPAAAATGAAAAEAAATAAAAADRPAWHDDVCASLERAYARTAETFTHVLLESSHRDDRHGDDDDTQRVHTLMAALRAFATALVARMGASSSPPVRALYDARRGLLDALERAVQRTARADAECLADARRHAATFRERSSVPALMLLPGACAGVLGCQNYDGVDSLSAAQFLLRECEWTVDALAYARDPNYGAMLVDALFHNYHEWLPRGAPPPPGTTTAAAAAALAPVGEAVRAACVAHAFAETQRLRHDYDFVHNLFSQQLLQSYGVLAPVYFARLLRDAPQHDDDAATSTRHQSDSPVPAAAASDAVVAYRSGDGGGGGGDDHGACRALVATAPLRRVTPGRRVNIVAPSIDAVNGISSQWSGYMLDERATYTIGCALPYQMSAERFLYYDNYISDTQHTRGRGAMQQRHQDVLETYFGERGGEVVKCKTRRTTFTTVSSDAVGAADDGPKRKRQRKA